MGTSKVRLGSDLERKGWLKDGLLADVHKSFWHTFTGSTSDAVVYQRNDPSCGNGHTVVFDYSGKLTGKAYRGDDYTYGKGEIKRKFSDKITVDEFSLYTDNGSKFDGCNIDDLSLSQHSNSRSQLTDLFYRQKDQGIFDVAQGSVGTPPTHIYDMGTAFEYNDLLYIETAAKKGTGLKKPDANGVVSADAATRRAPLRAWTTEGGANIYLCIVDEYMASKIKANPKYQTIIMNADVRGNNNRLINMVIGKIGNVVYVEAPVFFGTTEGKGTFDLHSTEVEFSGLRSYAVNAAGEQVWEGQVEFGKVEDLLAEDLVNGNTVNADAGNAIYSRGLLMGAGALQSAFGQMPNYELEWADFKKTSQSMLEYWCDYKKTSLTVEAGTDYAGKVADLDFAVIAIDMKHTNA